MDYPLVQSEEENDRLSDQFNILMPPELINLVSNKSKFLDIGCGTGEILNYLNKDIFYYGIDKFNNFKLELGDKVNFVQSECSSLDQYFVTTRGFTALHLGQSLYLVHSS
jgi:ubiquinone/menaquinone biosynthesis C-methylase UbiE